MKYYGFMSQFLFSHEGIKSATTTVEGEAEVRPCQFIFVVKPSLKFPTERIAVLDTICIELTYMSFIIKQLSYGAWTQ